MSYSRGQQSTFSQHTKASGNRKFEQETTDTLQLSLGFR